MSRLRSPVLALLLSAAAIIGTVGASSRGAAQSGDTRPMLKAARSPSPTPKVTPGPTPHQKMTYKRPYIEWSGHAWYARDSDFRSGGPGRGGNWSRRNVTVNTDGTLTMKATNPTGKSPVAAELVSRETFGYGSYSVTVEGPFTDLHPAYVFGVFTFDWSGTAQGPGYNEIDIGEISKWGKSATSISAAYYPDAGGTRKVAKVLWPKGLTRATLRLVWLPRTLMFQAFAGDSATGVPFLNSSVTAVDTPVPKHEAVHINLWDGQWAGKPADGASAPETTVTLVRFSHTRPMEVRNP